METKTKVRNILKSFREAIKTARDYNRAMESIGLRNAPIPPQRNPEVVKISVRTPFDYDHAESLYNLSIEYGIPLENIINWAYAGVSPDTIRAAISK